MESFLDNFNQLDQKPLREKVSMSIRRAILRGDFKSGDRLVETELAETMGVSRTPVREALRMLENEKLVRRNPGGGVEVVGFSLEDIIELYMIREALEAQAAIISIKRITAEELKELYYLVDLSEEKLNDEDPAELFSVLRKFNHILLYSCRMPRLIRLVSDYHEYLDYLRKRTMITPERRQKVIKEHGEIVNAIEQKDTAMTESIVRNHLRGAMKSYLEGLNTVTEQEKEKAFQEVSILSV